MQSIYLKSIAGDMSKGALSNRHTKIKIDIYDLDIVEKFLINQTKRQFFYIRDDYTSEKSVKLHKEFLDIVEKLIDNQIFLDKYYARTTWEMITPK